MYVQFTLSVQKGHIRYTVAPKGAYRPQSFALNFGWAMYNVCRFLKNTSEKTYETYDRRIQRP